jgi:hypothetical protein
MKTPASNVKISRVVITFDWDVCLCVEAFTVYLFTHVDVDVRSGDTRVGPQRQIGLRHQLGKSWKFGKLFIKGLFDAKLGIWMTGLCHLLRKVGT